MKSMRRIAEQDELIRQLDWNLLRTFMFVVQDGSITLAAKRLMRRQPSVSQALQRLEAQLGTVLIDRSPSHFRVTPAGQALYQECLETFGSLARAIQTAQGTEDTVTGTVRLALLSRVENAFFDDILTEFHRQFPEVRFDIEVMSSKGVREAVLAKTASLGVCLVNDAPPNLETEILYRTYFGFYCGPSHPLFGKDSLSLDDLRDHTSVSFHTDHLWDALRPVALLRAQHKLDNMVIGYTSDLDEARRMITAGLGFGPLPVHVAEKHVATGKLWRLPPYENSLAIDIHLVHHRTARLSRAESALLNLFQTRLNATSLAERSDTPGLDN